MVADTGVTEVGEAEITVVAEGVVVVVREGSIGALGWASLCSQEGGASSVGARFCRIGRLRRGDRLPFSALRARVAGPELEAGGTALCVRRTGRGLGGAPSTGGAWEDDKELRRPGRGLGPT